MRESVPGHQIHPYRASELSAAESAKKGISWLNRSATGRRLGQALIAAGLLVHPSEALQSDSTGANSRAHSEGKPYASEKEPSITVEGVEDAWGIPNALYRSWLQESFPRMVGQEHLATIRFGVHPAPYAHETRLHTSRSHGDHRLLGQLATQSDGRVAISLFQAATQESDPTLIAPPGMAVSFSENPAQSPDTQFENALRLQIRAFSRALLSHVPEQQFQRVNERLTRELHEAGLTGGSSDRLFSSHDRFESDTRGDSSWGILTAAAEEAFLQAPESTPETFAQEVVIRLRGHIYGGVRPEIADKLMKSVYHELEELMRFVNPQFSFASTAAGRVARTEEMRSTHRTHRTELMMTTFLSDPTLRECALRYARADHTIEGEEGRAERLQERLHAPETRTTAHLSIHPYTPSELALIAWNNLFHTLKDSHSDPVGYRHFMDALQLFSREWQHIPEARRSRLRSELVAASHTSV